VSVDFEVAPKEEVGWESQKNTNRYLAVTSFLLKFAKSLKLPFLKYGARFVSKSATAAATMGEQAFNLVCPRFNRQQSELINNLLALKEHYHI